MASFIYLSLIIHHNQRQDHKYKLIQKMIHNGKGCLIENESRILKSNQARTRKEIKTVQKDSNAVRRKVE